MVSTCASHPIHLKRNKKGKVVVTIGSQSFTIYDERHVDQLAFALQQMGGQNTIITIRDGKRFLL